MKINILKKENERKFSVQLDSAKNIAMKNFSNAVIYQAMKDLKADDFLRWLTSDSGNLYVSMSGESVDFFMHQKETGARYLSKTNRWGKEYKRRRQNESNG